MNVKVKLRACGKGLVSVVVAVLCGCQAMAPAERSEAAAARLALETDVVEGAGFRHRVFRLPAEGAPRVRADVQRALHIYFGGDGTPFVTRERVARDPTPRRPLTLELMSAGPRPAVFIGRPCYHGLTDGCDPTLWTTARYGEPVVHSMAAAVRRIIAAHEATQVTLVGYSGGGTLALLVAERLPEVDVVASLAANLDVDAWTRRHGFTALGASLDPVAAAGRRPSLIHRHWTGAADDNVPPAIHDRLRPRLPPSAFVTVPEFDHRCCWVRAWPELAAELDAAVTAPSRAPSTPPGAPSPAPGGSPGSRPPP